MVTDRKKVEGHGGKSIAIIIVMILHMMRQCLITGNLLSQGVKQKHGGYGATKR